MGKTPEPITRTDAYLVEIIGLLKAIESNMGTPKPAPKPAPKKGK